MNKRPFYFRLFYFSCLLWIIPFSLKAADRNHGVVKPTPPVRWEVEISVPPDYPLQNTAVVREECTVTNKIRKESFTFKDGTRFDRYIFSGLIIYMDPRTDRPAIQSTAEDIFFGGMPLSDSFPEFDWVDGRWYQGTRILHDRSCNVYIHPWPLSHASAKNLPSVKDLSKLDKSKFAIAYIDTKSRLPVLLETPTEIRAYTFTFNVSTPTLPAALEKELARREAAIRWRKQRFKIPQ